MNSVRVCVVGGEEDGGGHACMWGEEMGGAFHIVKKHKELACQICDGHSPHVSPAHPTPPL